MHVYYKYGLLLIFALHISNFCMSSALQTSNSSYRNDYIDDNDDDYYDEVVKDIPAKKIELINIGAEKQLAAGKNLSNTKIVMPKRTNHVLQPICPQECHCMKDFKYIQCTNIGLTRVPYDIPHTAIHIDISKNRISKLRASDFVNYTKVIELNLAGNELTEISPEAFTELPRLQRLSVAHNHLIHIEPNTFANVRDLSTLDLSHNSIMMPSETSFLNQPRLLELACQNCSWTQLYDKTFQNLNGLTALRLDKNDFNKKINTRAFAPLQNLIKLTLPTLEQQSVTELCSLLKSIDTISFSNFDISCYELVLGATFNESLILTSERPFNTGQQEQSSKESNETSLANNNKSNNTTNMALGGNTQINETWPNMTSLAPDESSNSTQATVLSAGVGSSSSKAVETNANDSAYQVPVSQQAINIMLISMMVIALVGILIGIICRKDVGGIKTKCCRTSKTAQKDDDHPAEEIPLNKLV